jgi:transcription elongation factor Elf1
MGFIRLLKKSFPTYSTAARPRNTQGATSLPEHQYIQNVQKGDGSVDGVWWCGGCNQEKHLVHVSGPHPFGHLQCGRCSQSINSRALTTEIIGRYVMDTGNHVPVPAFQDHVNIPFSMVCAACGLTHRAKEVKEHSVGASMALLDFSDVKCECGHANSERWYRFSIGSSADWKTNQSACYDRALKRKLARALETHS